MKIKTIQKFFTKNYSESWNYLKETKNFIYVIMILFSISIFAGFFFPAPESIIKQIFEFIEELLTRTENMTQFELIRFIFLNNFQSSFTGMIFGIFLGIFPIIATIINGYLLGFVASLSVNVEGVFTLWRLLPHGIFELPAVFISLALGVRLGTFVFYDKKLEKIRKDVIGSFRVFIFVVIPLLIIAAIIEGSLISLTR